MTLYRVFPHIPSAGPGSLGNPLFIPRQGGGRLDNPDKFTVLYLSNSAAGAIAEAFGRLPEWNPAMLSTPLAGAQPAVARYRMTAGKPVCDLDDASRLLALGFRPSDVVSRDYDRTRAWARRIFLEGVWYGVRWWSYYDPGWASFGIWDVAGLHVEEVHALSLDDGALREAARTISRRVTAKPLHTSR